MPRQGKSCMFLGCLSRSKKHPDKKFYPFVKPWIDREKCLRWIAATGKNDLPLEYINKGCYVCGDHFVNACPSVENPDPLPYCAVWTYQVSILEASVDDAPELGESFVKRPRLGDVLSPERQAAILKKEVPSQKESFQLSQPSYSLPAADESKVTTQASTSEFHHSTPVIPTEDICALKRKLFDDFMTDIEENNANENQRLSPFLDFLSQDAWKDNVNVSGICEKDGKHSVKTQTINRRTLDRLTTTDNLPKSETGSTGVEIIWAGEDDEEAEERNDSTAQEKKNQTIHFSFESITSDDDFEYLSGMSRQNFELLYKYLGGDEVCSRLKYEAETGTPKIISGARLSLKCRLFMTLCHMRRGFTERELSIFFGCSASLVSRILNTWINFMYLKLKPLEEYTFHGRRSQRLNMPQPFNSFKELRIIIDCIEIQIETPCNVQEQSDTWSSYRHSYRVKYLVGINVHGAVCYVSDAFDGSMSDKKVFVRSTMYDMLQPGDVVMADRRFDVSEDLDRNNVKLVIPSYLKRNDFITTEEEIWSEKILRASIFVKKATGRIKMWRILNSTFPQSDLTSVSQMMFICAYLTNFQPLLL